MTEEDRILIIQFKTDVEALAKKGQELASRGFIVGFSVNVQSGTVDNFSVKQTTEVDLDSLVDKPVRKN